MLHRVVTSFCRSSIKRMKRRKKPAPAQHWTRRPFIEILEQRDLPASYFQVLSLTGNNAMVVDHNGVTSDDRGGIAVSTSQVFVTGDGGTGRFALSNLSGGTNIGATLDALTSNLRTQTVYSLGVNATTPMGTGGGTVTHLLEINGATGALTGTAIALSSPVVVGSNTGIFAGYDRAVLHPNNGNVFEIAIPTGIVTNLGAMTTPTHSFTESWAYWGVTENFGGADYITYVQDPTIIARKRISDGAVSTLATFSNLGETASFTISLSNNRWYFHHEDSSQFGGTAETVGYADATWLAADLFVTNTNDSGPGSLRQAIADSNVMAGTQSITFIGAGASGTITLTTGQLDITDSVTIFGPGAANLAVSGNNASRIFNDASAGSMTVTISGLKMTGGNAGANNGGAILNNNDNLTVTASVITGNTATSGGGIAAGSSLSLLSTTLANNTASSYGGGIFADSSSVALLVENSTIAGNTANRGGGMSLNGLSGSGATVRDSTISGNTGNLNGGAIQSSNSPLTIQNSTISDNRALAGAGGGIIQNGGTVTLASTIVANNTATVLSSDDLSRSGGTLHASNSLIELTPPAGTFNGTNTANIFGMDPLLDPLASNGGLTQTHALLFGSPARDTGSNPADLTTDQRGGGFARVIGTAPDIGAFEDHEIYVTNTSNSGTGSLRQAILDANASVGANAIRFVGSGASGTITLTTGQLDITDSVTILGPGAANLTISGNNSSRIFQSFNNITVSISGLTLTGGNGGGGGDGGAIFKSTGSLTVSNVVLSGNTATNGGALSTSGNTTLTVRDSTLSGNTVTGRGGAIAGSYGSSSVILEGSTFSHNLANQGGAIDLHSSYGAGLTVRNSTISGNTAFNSGGGIRIGYSFGTQHVIQNSTITGNTALIGSGGGIRQYGTTLTIQSTIVANNTDSSVSGDDLFRSGGTLHVSTSLIETTPGAGQINGTSSGNIFAVDPLLGPLASNGGPTQTHALLGGSPCLDTGANPSGLLTDQRGTVFPRVVGAAADIGAFEELKFFVTNTNDSGPGSLRQAVLNANATAGNDTICFTGAGAVGTIVLTSGNLTLTESVKITGPGAANLTISGNASNRFFLDGSGGTLTLTISGLTLSSPNGFTFPYAVELSGDLAVNAASSDIIFSNSLNIGASALTLTDGNKVDLGPNTNLAGGALNAANGIRVGSGATLLGNGTISGAVTVQAGGTVAPGPGAETLIVNGNLALETGGNLNINWNGTAADSFDQLIVQGAVDLGNSSNLNLVFGLVPAPGNGFVVIQNDQGEPVTGRVNGIANAGFVSIGGFVYQLRYDGGDGNDVEVVANQAPELHVGVATTLPTVLEDAPTSGNNGTSVDDLLAIGTLYTDVNRTPPAGLAVTGQANTNGTWQFTLNGGTTWTPFGPVSATQATLLLADGFGQTRIRFLSNANFAGTTSFSFKGWDTSDGKVNGATGVNASTGGGNTAYSTQVETATLTILAVNDSPVAGNDAYSVSEDNTLTVAVGSGVRVNDNDVETSQLFLTVSLLAGPIHGSLALSADGSFVYSPAANYHGSDQFTYLVNDGNGGFAVGSVNVTVTPLNDNPTAVNDAFIVNEDSGSNALGVMANDSASPDSGETLMITALAMGPLHGMVIISGGGTGLTYTPNAGYSGTDSFTYEINDGNGGMAQAVVFITVTSINDPPNAVDDTTVAEENGASVAVHVLDNDTDPDGNPRTIVRTSSAAHGSVFIANNGTPTNPADDFITYTPSANFFGRDTFIYDIADGNGGMDSATVTITVSPHHSFLATGTDAGPLGRVRIYHAVTGAENCSFVPYTGFTGGVRVAVADVTGDGIADIITAPGPNMAGGARVKVFDGMDLIEGTASAVFSFLPYGAAYTGEVFVAAGRFNGDVLADIVTGNVASVGPVVKVFDSADLPAGDPVAELIRFQPFAATYSGGARVAVGDVNGDGINDVIAGMSQNGSRVTAFSGANFATVLVSINVSPTAVLKKGVFVAGGNVDGDSRVDIVVGFGNKSEVRVYEDAIDTNTKATLLKKNAQVYPLSFKGGIRTCAVDLDDDGDAEVVCAPGAGAERRLRILDGLTLATLDELFAEHALFTAGLFVAGGRLG